jgi:HEAT repeat protein
VAFTPPTLQKLSDQELQNLQALPPQQQAEQMMMAAVNHYDGIPAMILDRLEGWRGKLKKTENWDTAELAARYSSDLRVRSAGVQLDLVVNNIEKTSDMAERLLSDAGVHVGNRGFNFYMLGMLANQGIQTDRIHAALKEWAHDKDEGTRFWAIEGLAFIGTEDTISDFLEILRKDPSLNVRQRCGASLAKSGMLTREQRMKAVPGLLEIANDKSEDAATQGWAFEALREITAEQIGNDATAWQTWIAAHSSERTDQFRNSDPNWVLGNS